VYIHTHAYTHTHEALIIGMQFLDLVVD
jgi:hypothetical protein